MSLVNVISQCHSNAHSTYSLTYIFEVWYHLCTQDEWDMLLHLFSEVKLDCDITAAIEGKAFDAAVSSYRPHNHYFSKRNRFICFITRTARSVNSFVPFSKIILNQ